MSFTENPEALPGVLKKSFSMFFGGGEIWFEHLDGIYGYTCYAIEKLKKDAAEFQRPSRPSLFALNIDETEVNDDLIKQLSEILLSEKKRFTRVVIVGASFKTKRKMKNALKGASFMLNFINDFEEAKEWLVSEKCC